MRKIFNLFIVIAIVTAIVPIPGCDIVEEPYLVPAEAGNIYKRQVLLEDYTGQQCPNCPEAAALAQGLKSKYKEHLVLLSIHAGAFSIPETTGDFTADYRTEEGDDLNSSFGFPGYPMGMVNRTEYNGTRLLLKDSWESAVDDLVELDSLAKITITNDYNPGTRKLDCELGTTFWESLDGTYYICVFITESGIISPQKTKDGINLTYEHNHVLRASMNGTWGDLVGSDGQAISGLKLTNNYSYTLPAAWNAENCSVVAFVYNNATSEVLQAEEQEF